MERLEKVLDGKDGGGPYQHSGGTLNYRWMRYSYEYYRAIHWGDNEELKTAREKLIGLYESEKFYGHMSLGAGTEQFCPDPHENFYIVSQATIRKGALDTNDEAILELNLNWLKGHAFWLRKCSSPTYEVAIPGARAKHSPPKWEVHEAFLRELDVQKQPAGVERRLERKDRDWRGILEIRRLRGRIPINKFRSVDVKLALPIEFKKTEHGHMARMSNPKGLNILTPVWEVELNWRTKELKYSRDQR